MRMDGVLKLLTQRHNFINTCKFKYQHKDISISTVLFMLMSLYLCVDNFYIQN